MLYVNPPKSLSMVENLPPPRVRRRHRKANPSEETKMVLWAAGGTLAVGLGLGLLLGWMRRRGAVAHDQVREVAIPGAATRTARKTTSFHLRPTATASSVGTELPAGTTLTLLEPTGIVRSGGTLWKVRTPQGVEGWTFVLPSEIQG